MSNCIHSVGNRFWRVARIFTAAHPDLTCCYALSVWASVTGLFINWYSGWSLAPLLLYGYSLLLAGMPILFGREHAVFRRRMIPATHGLISAAIVTVGGGYESPFLYWVLLVPLIAGACDDATASAFWTMIVAMFLPLILFTDPNTWRSVMPSGEQLIELTWIGPLSTLLLILILGTLSTANILERERQVEALAAEAQLEFAAKRDFLAKMSHELRTPLTAILGFAEELAMRISGHHPLRAAEAIQRNSRAMLTSLEDLLEWGRIECGAVPLQCAKHATPDLMNSAQAAVAALPAPQISNVSLTYEGPVPAHLTTDGQFFEKTIVKSAAAAFQATGRGGIHLYVRTCAARQILEIDIGPHGETWDIKELLKLVDRSATAPSVSGGFSLAMARGLVQLLGGSLDIVQSSHSAVVRLEIPTGPIDHAQLIKPSASGPSADGVKELNRRSPRLDDCRVLLVEDSPDTKALITFLLSRAGADVQAVDNGHAAIAAALTASARGTPFDIVLMDMQMPVMNGREATERLRKAGYDRPIIAFTAQAIEYTREKCLCSGCNDYLTKPFRSHELIELVARYARNNLEAVMSS